MTGIWLIVWALHGLPALSNAKGINAWGIWLCVCGALDFFSHRNGVI